jgi:undecaprenyl-diphosphatase
LQVPVGLNSKRLKVFLITQSVFLIVGLVMLALWGYEQSFLYLNHLRLPWLDRLMPHYTHLGDGFIITTLLIMSLIAKDRAMVLSVIVAMLIIAALLPILKQLIFAGWMRPAKTFPADQFFFLSLGQERYFSFPSGHSAAAAAMTSLICIAAEKQKAWWGMVWALLAVSIAWSRIYIGAHFLGDTVAGLMLGLLVGIGSVRLFYKPFANLQSHHSWIGRRTFGSILWLLAGALLVASLVHIWLSYYR